MPQRADESIRQYHERVHGGARSFYTEVLPLSDQDKSDLTISVKVLDEAESIARFTIDLVDAATSGDPSARAVIDAELRFIESKEQG